MQFIHRSTDASVLRVLLDVMMIVVAALFFAQVNQDRVNEERIKALCPQIVTSTNRNQKQIEIKVITITEDGKILQDGHIISCESLKYTLKNVKTLVVKTPFRKRSANNPAVAETLDCVLNKAYEAKITVRVAY